MNENQKAFLLELAELLDKYSVDSVENDNDSVVFWSNGSTLSFDHYRNGKFECIEYHCEQDCFEPFIEGNKNE